MGKPGTETRLTLPTKRTRVYLGVPSAPSLSYIMSSLHVLLQPLGQLMTTNHPSTHTLSPPLHPCHHLAGSKLSVELYCPPVVKPKISYALAASKNSRLFPGKSQGHTVSSSPGASSPVTWILGSLAHSGYSNPR